MRKNRVHAIILAVSLSPASMYLRRFLPAALLALAALLIWCAATGRWTLAAWNAPFSLNGDPLEIYARVQAAADDPSQPLRGYAQVSRLAAPFAADWTRYPVSDRVVFTLLGWLARATNVFAAINLAMVAAHILNALAFYACARFLRWRLPWALAFALLFSFSSYNFRWGITVSFSLTFALPPLLLLCGWIARHAPAIKARGWTWLAVVLGAWLGGANPYLAFFAGQLGGFATALQWLRRRETARGRAGIVFLGVLLGSFLLHNAAYFLANPDTASRLTLSRNYAGSEIYALKLTDLIIPPAEHALPPLAEIGRLYRARAAFRTEFFVNYLGIFGICGLAGLLGLGFRWAAQGRLRRRLPDALLGVSWTLLFASAGGINSLLALGGLDIFRASSRYSIFILIWALFFLGRWCQRVSFQWKPALVAAIAAGVAVFGVLDSLPFLPVREQLRANAASIAHHRNLAAALETRLGAGARIFQLPATRFPEAGLTVMMGDYEHFLPYLASDTLQISYGALRRTTSSRVIRSVGQLPVEKMKKTLETAGFHAVWVDRRGFTDYGEQVIKDLRDQQLEEFPQTFVRHVALFLLRPSTVPKPFDSTNPGLYERWDPANTTPPIVRVLTGWDDLERAPNRSWRWAQESASIGIQMPSAGPVQLSFLASCRTNGELTLELDGREIWSKPSEVRVQREPGLTLDLPAGWHRLTWRFDGRLRPAGGGDGRMLGFSIENLTLIAPR